MKLLSFSVRAGRCSCGGSGENTLRGARAALYPRFNRGSRALLTAGRDSPRLCVKMLSGVGSVSRGRAGAGAGSGLGAGVDCVPGVTS